MIGATIYLLELPKSGATSNAYGFYSVTAPAGTYTLIVSFGGYKRDSVKLELNNDVLQTIELIHESAVLQEVVVKSIKGNGSIDNLKSIMGVQKLSIDEIKTVPVIFGEKDVLKTIQLLPGVKSAGEGSAGFYVRGGGSDQNLILLDEAPVYNASHMLGFFSSFNSDAIKDLTLYKGAMPAEYGGRLSSVVDIKMNDGNNKEYHVNGGIGLIASRLSVEGPIVKDKGSFIISGRRTYADLFLKLSSDSSLNQTDLNFYDINLKANYTINDKNRIYLSGYLGRDRFFQNSSFGIDYGNTTATVRLNHIFSSKLFSNTSFIYSNYDYTVTGNLGLIQFVSKIEDIAIKQDLQYYANANNKINFGFNVIRHNVSPGVINAAPGASYNSFPVQSKYAYESAAYISHDLTIKEKIKINYGLRVSVFSIMGPGNFYTYDSKGNVVKTATYGRGEFVKTYFNAEPRFSASYQLNTANSIKLSYTRNVQNLHLLSNSVSLNPTDIWIPTSLNVKPEIADQVSIGYYKNFGDNKYEFSSEAYYKNMQNQIDYKNGAELLANENVESQLLYGKGRAYGLELFVKKKYGKLSGWVSYTLSKTEKQIAGINNGSWYNARQDQTHNIAIVGIYKASKKWALSANFVYNTGNAVTFPSSKYNAAGQTLFYYTERNGYRMPAYHRLDFGATMLGRQGKKWQGSWTFSLYNVYGRENAYTIAFEDHPDDPTKTRAVQTSLFRWVPSVTYNFKF